MPEKHKQSAATKIDVHNLDAVLSAFVTAAQNREASRVELYESFNRRLIASTGSLAAAVFSKRPDSQFTMVSQSGWQDLDATAVAEVKQSIKKSCLTGEHLTSHRLSTFIGRTTPINGVEFLYVLVRPNEPDPLVEQLLKDLTEEITSQIETYEIRRAENQKPKAIHDLTHLVQLAQNVGRSSSLTELSMHLVNDLAKATGADRVCFFSPNGKLLAVSGVSQVALKTALARNLSRIARVAKKIQSPIESSADQVVLEDFRRQKSINQWLGELESEIVYVSPVATNGHCSGVVSLEYFQKESLERDWIDQRNLISQLLSFIAPVVGRAVQINAIPGFRLLDFLFNRVLIRPLRFVLWIVTMAALAFAGFYVLFLVERPLEIAAEGVLQPTVQRNVFSPGDGQIQSLKVAEGSLVTAGQLLAVIESKSLSDQRIVVEGELAETLQQLQNLAVAGLQFDRADDDSSVEQQMQTAAETERLESKSETLQRRLTLLQQREEELKLLAPIDGQVTTPDLDHRLESRPVSRGDLLMSISQLDGQWEIELLVPDSRIEFIQAAESPKLRFRVAADSEAVYEGQLREFDYRVTESGDQSLTYTRAFVDFDESELGANLRLGSRVLAKVDCGKQSNWFLLTYELKQKLKEWFLW